MALSTEAVVFFIGTSAFAAVFGWMAYLRAQIRNLSALLQSREAKLRNYATELIRAEEEERARVARELHDGLGQLIAAVNLELEALRAQGPLPDAVIERIDDVRTLASQIGADVRRMAHELRPAILDELGLHDALSALTRRMSRPPRLTVDLNVHGNLIVVPPDLRLTCYRIAQEALTNVVRHSGASRAEVNVDLDAHALRLAIGDNGTGIADQDDLSKIEGFGLTGLRERVEAVGGSLRISRAELGGLLIAAELPVG